MPHLEKFNWKKKKRRRNKSHLDENEIISKNPLTLKTSTLRNNALIEVTFIERNKHCSHVYEKKYLYTFARGPPGNNHLGMQCVWRRRYCSLVFITLFNKSYFGLDFFLLGRGDLCLVCVFFWCFLAWTW